MDLWNDSTEGFYVTQSRKDYVNSGEESNSEECGGEKSDADEWDY